ncbi:MAG: proline--tRNA ligase [Mycoplasmoidaceae bacterium]
MDKHKNIVLMEKDFAKWYTSVIINSDVAEYGLVKGTMVIKPYGYKIWSNVVKLVDKFFLKENIENCIFPAFIPYSFFVKEKNHIQGFKPELFKIERVCGVKIDDPYILRPTSEILFCNYFLKNIKNYNDLPMKLNQWCNVFRIEKNTKLFLRTSEFFWQEQHSAFADLKTAELFTKKIIFLYKKIFEEYLAIPVLIGKKTENEKFAGALITYTLETIMKDGQVLQCGTSHFLGTNFSKTFNIKFQNKNNKYEYIFQTSAGISSRIMGAIIMTHSDNNGLIIPPKIAPIQIRINTFFSNKDENIIIYANKIASKLKGFRIEIDSTVNQPGFKICDGELKGIPIQINIGPRSIINNQIEIMLRDGKEKQNYSIDIINKKFIKNILDKYHHDLFKKAKDNIDSKIVEIFNYDEFKKEINMNKVILAFWSGKSEDESKIKLDTGATPRCIIQSNDCGKCFYTGIKTKFKVYFGRSY